MATIRKLSLFGSALHGELRLESDIDLLVEFDEEHIPSIFGLVQMEEELSPLLGGRKVDMRTPKDLSRYFRNEVIESAEVLHVEP
ncbi:MAG: nucleotidyltransferase domain-containing protein [Bacillota bacterium]|nr:nucleotidyltransferase domain-containing protein [Bacillota bacterium]